MPALPAVPGVIRVDTHWTYTSNVVAADRFFLGYTGSLPSSAQLNTYATQVQGAFQSHIAAVANMSIQYVLFQVTDLSSSSGAIGTNSTVVTGTRSGSGLQAQSCVLLNGHVLRRYRGGKPRMYPPWGVATDIGVPTGWTTAFISAVNAAWASTISDLSVVPWSGATILGQANVSYYSGYGTPTLVSENHYKNHVKARDVPVVDHITSMTCNPKVGTQRRRVAA